MTPSRNPKIVPIKKKAPMNIGIVMFILLFIYLLISVVLYFTSPHVTVYEVTAGTLVNANTYTAAALREETVVYAQQAGSIHYYARESEKIASGALIFSIDEGGRLAEAVHGSDGVITDLTSKSIMSLKNQMQSFSANYSGANFASTYDFKYEIESSLLDIINTNVLSNIETLSQSDGNGKLFSMSHTTSEGVVVYFTDGLEEMSAETFSTERIREENYERRNLRGSELINAGEPAYKLITDENWQLIFPIDEKQATELADTDEDEVQITFLKDNTSATAKFSILRNEEDEVFVCLDLADSMIRFATERFVDIELKLDKKSGLKIPNSAIVEKTFFTVPKEFKAYGGNNSEAGFLREVYEGTEVTTEFVATSIYHETEDEYYIDAVTFNPGDTLIRPDSTQKYQISQTATLQGVYNINKGYAVFREINIIDSNEEYCIVEESTNYGLAQYDHIVLDCNAVREDDVVY